MSNAQLLKRISGRFWRMLAPKWAHAPLSGEGAALYGGRYNARGQPVLYMSVEISTAIAEYQQDLGIRPGTLCAYAVDMPDIVDLTDSDMRETAGTSLQALHSPWKQILLVDGEIPVTWSIAERLAGDGAKGILAGSSLGAGINLVLWDWQTGPNQSVTALDPLADLPRNQSSWT